MLRDGVETRYAARKSLLRVFGQLPMVRVNTKQLRSADDKPCLLRKLTPHRVFGRFTGCNFAAG